MALRSSSFRVPLFWISIDGKTPRSVSVTAMLLDEAQPPVDQLDRIGAAEAQVQEKADIRPCEHEPAIGGPDRAVVQVLRISPR